MAVVLVLVLALAACGSGYSNKKLGLQVTKAIGANTPLVCWSQHGFLRGAFNHSYNRVCGVNRTQGTVFLSVDTKKRTWCAVSPRYGRLPVCP